MPTLFFVGLVVIAFLLGRASAATWWPPSSAPAATPALASPAVVRELAERDVFIEQLRELAWQHRDVAPELSTIIIDEISTHHRRQSGPDA